MNAAPVMTWHAVSIQKHPSPLPTWLIGNAWKIGVGLPSDE
jgi:hypothetical protein